MTYDETAVRWPAIPSAARIVLKGKLTAEETAAAGPCLPTVGHQVVTIDLDETLPGDATSRPLALPALPAGEHWTVTANLIDFSALDADGNNLAGTRLMQIVESCGFGATATPAFMLPSTGSAADGGEAAFSRDAIMLSLACWCAGLGALAYAVSRRAQ